MVCSIVAMRHQGALPYGCEYLYKVWSDMKSDGAQPCGYAYLMKEEIIWKWWDNTHLSVGKHIQIGMWESPSPLVWGMIELCVRITPQGQSSYTALLAHPRLLVFRNCGVKAWVMCQQWRGQYWDSKQEGVLGNTVEKARWGPKASSRQNKDLMSAHKDICEDT